MTITAPLMTTSLRCTPRWATRRRPERPTFGGELADIGRALGQPFMPHQRLIADVGGEFDPDTGMPFYREIVVTVPRQSGKTTLFLSWQIHRCTSPRWAQPQRSAFTAQSGKDARDKWLDELFPLIRRSPKIRRLVAASRGGLAINEGMGNESIRFRNGSLIRLLSTSSSSGHSKTLHQAVLDEIWHDQDGRREQGLRPAMITVDDAQLLVCSTAGTDESLVLNGKVERGRAGVEADQDSGVAYFEWSAPDGWDPEDEDSYFGFMPALCPDPPCRCGVDDGGWRHTVTLGTLRAERASKMAEPGEFERAYGNRRKSRLTDENKVITPSLWADLADPPEQRPSEVTFALVVNQHRTVAYIAYAGRDEGDPEGMVRLGLADRLTDVSKAPARLLELRERHNPVGVSVKARSESLLLELQREGLSVPDDPEQPRRGDLHVPSATQDAAATGLLLDAARSQRVRHAADLPVDTALGEAKLRPSAGGVTWDDKAGDMAPLRAVCHALWLFESWAHLVAGDYDALANIY